MMISQYVVNSVHGFVLVSLVPCFSHPLHKVIDFMALARLHFVLKIPSFQNNFDLSLNSLWKLGSYQKVFCFLDFFFHVVKTEPSSRFSGVPDRTCIQQCSNIPVLFQVLQCPVYFINSTFDNCRNMNMYLKQKRARLQHDTFR